MALRTVLGETANNGDQVLRPCHVIAFFSGSIYVEDSARKMGLRRRRGHRGWHMCGGLTKTHCGIYEAILRWRLFRVGNGVGYGASRPVVIFGLVAVLLVTMASEKCRL